MTAATYFGFKFEEVELQDFEYNASSLTAPGKPDN